MKSYGEFKIEMEIIQYFMVKAQKTEHANALKEVKPLSKEFDFIGGDAER